jgi:small subunit ribosomal protein S17
MQTLVGKVVKTNTDKSVVILVESFVIHPKYQKRMARSKKFLVVDEIGLNEGDKVMFQETKPMSKSKCWKAVEVIK